MGSSNYLGKPRSDNDLRVLPESVIARILQLAENPDYVHVTGCGDTCHNCPGDEVPMYRKIARATGIDTSTVHAYLDSFFRQKLQQRSREYKQSLGGRITRSLYESSPKGVARTLRYRASERGKAVWVRIRKKRRGES